jgi:hypothetical protein
LTTSNRCVCAAERVCGSPIQTTKAPARLITSIRPPTRRAYSLRHDQLPKSPIDVPSGRPVMYALSSFPPKPSTTARGRSSLTRALISSNQLNTSGRVSPVATRPSTVPTGSIAGLPPAARTIAYPGVITSESPATQIFSFFLGEKASFFGLAGFDAGGGVRVVGRVVVRPGPGDCAGAGAGRPRSVSISSASERPTSACRPLRGRSRSSAWLTPASGPVTARATSRCQPSGLL